MELGAEQNNYNALLHQASTTLFELRGTLGAGAADAQVGRYLMLSGQSLAALLPSISEISPDIAEQAAYCCPKELIGVCINYVETYAKRTPFAAAWDLLDEAIEPERFNFLAARSLFEEMTMQFAGLGHHREVASLLEVLESTEFIRPFYAALYAELVESFAHEGDVESALLYLEPLTLNVGNETADLMRQEILEKALSN